jgi:hypothetical protein
MEMKDIILSTLQEFEEEQTTGNSMPNTQQAVNTNNNHQLVASQTQEKRGSQTGIEELRSIMNSVQKVSDSSHDENNNIATAHQIPIETPTMAQQPNIPTNDEPSISDTLKNRSEISLVNQIENEARFLNSLRERILVVFEGLQSPNNRNLDAKVDLIINFMEYQLAIVDERIENLRKGF